MSISARQAALNALIRVERDASYSNITLDGVLSENDISSRDKAFATKLFYGVIEKKQLLDYNLSRLCDKPLNKLDIAVLVILRMGLYQLFFTESVHSAAAVDESVKLCKANECVSASGFVNGVLRSAAKLKEPVLPKIQKGKNKYWSIKYSCPEPIIKLWRQSYGDEMTVGILSALEGRPPLCARINTIKTNIGELQKSFEESGIKAEKSEILSDCLLLEDTGAVETLPQYKQGLFHIQDASSQICCQLLSPEKGDTVLDVCSAPGGKSFTLAQLMKNDGTLISCDLYESRLRLVKSGAERLGIDIIKTVACDSAKYNEFPMADRVLCDVPCSGLGIIRRKPELRYKSDMGLDTLPDLQYLILCNCSRFVKSGGLLVYSTCTLNPQENSGTARRFLLKHGDFEEYPIRLPQGVSRGIDERENELTLFPHSNNGNTDGFFISIFRKK